MDIIKPKIKLIKIFVIPKVIFKTPEKVIWTRLFIILEISPSISWIFDNTLSIK